MKNFLLTLASVLLLGVGYAQNPTDNAAVKGPQSEWLQTFVRLEIEGPMDVVLVPVGADQAPKIIYDTKGAYTSKFRYQVKDRVLRLSERNDPRRPERTTVTVYYTPMKELFVCDAAVVCQEVVLTDLLDLTLTGNASFTGELDVKDLKMIASGHSTAQLSGVARYLTLSAVSAKVDAADLETMSAIAEAKSSAQVRLNVSERIEARTSMKGSISFKGKPSIVRGEGVRFMGGDIVGVEN